MRSRFPSSWVDEVFARSDIVDIVSSYVPLKKQGRNYSGLCPFHSEKTPSFSVNRENNVYHCFGCKAGGSVIQFVMEMERLSYPDALMHLAKLAGIAPPVMEYNPKAEQERSQRERLLSANREAAHFYHERLFSEKGAPMLQYLHDRGLDDSVIRRFGLGASEDEWTSLMDEMLARGYTKEELALAGLIHVRENGAYDSFRGRTMFPILDLHGNVLGFGARAMGKMQPKYLNTQDTPVFNKRLGIYGINMLRKLRNPEHLILVEGYMDVITMTRYGIEGVVATLGTALTPEQARLMKKYAPEIWVAYDGDEAGQTATMRALDTLAQESVPAKVLRLPVGQDPDDLLQAAGMEGFDRIVPMGAMHFRLERLKLSYAMDHEEGIGAYSIQACEMIAALPDPIERERHAKRLALETGIHPETVMEQLRVALARAKQAPVRRDTAPAKPAAKPEFEKDESSSSERLLLSLLAGGLLSDGMVLAADFSNPFHARMAEALLGGMSPARFLDDLEDANERSAAGEVLGRQVEMSREQAQVAAEDCMVKLHSLKLDDELKRLTRVLSTETQADVKKRALQDFMRIQKERSELRSAPQIRKDVS